MDKLLFLVNVTKQQYQNSTFWKVKCTVFTTRQRSFGKVMFSQMSVCPHGGGDNPWCHVPFWSLVPCPFQGMRGISGPMFLLRWVYPTLGYPTPICIPYPMNTLTPCIPTPRRNMGPEIPYPPGMDMGSEIPYPSELQKCGRYASYWIAFLLVIWCVAWQSCGVPLFCGLASSSDDYFLNRSKNLWPFWDVEKFEPEERQWIHLVLFTFAIWDRKKTLISFFKGIHLI